MKFVCSHFASDKRIRLHCDIVFRGENEFDMKVGLDTFQKEKKVEEIFLLNFISVRVGPEKSTEARQR